MKPVEVRDGHKACTSCGEWKPLTDFYPLKKRPAGRESRCCDCERARRQVDSEAHRAYTRKHYRDNRQRYMDYGLANYGLTRDQYDALLAAQHGLCALCARPEHTLNKSHEIRALAVDHDHACCPGKKSCGRRIRGLLCHNCNIGISNFGDSVERLDQAIAYLSKRRGALLKEVV